MELLRAAGEGQKEESDCSQSLWGSLFLPEQVNQGWDVAEKRFKFTLLLLSVLFNLLAFPIPSQLLPASLYAPQAIPSQTYSVLGFQQPFPSSVWL